MTEIDRAVMATMAQALRVKAFSIYMGRWDAQKTQGAFERHVWSYMRDFFTSADRNAAFDFLDNMLAEIDNQYARAWNEGARSVGVDLADITENDRLTLAIEIRGEQGLLTGIAGDIERAKLEGLDDAAFNARFRNRAFMWSNRYNAVVDKAAAYYGQRQRFEWVLGQTEKHCHTGDGGKPGIGCADLAGTVLWGSEWDQVGIKPQTQTLNCKGYQCQCRLQPTDKRRTAGGLTRLLDMFVAASV